MVKPTGIWSFSVMHRLYDLTSAKVHKERGETARRKDDRCGVVRAHATNGLQWGKYERQQLKGDK